MLVYKTNKRGERTQPYEEMVEENSVSDKTSLTLTRWNLAVKKSINQLIKLESMCASFLTYQLECGAENS